ncbi:MAG: neutral/alkaline non-lysosomal ceramidase N-terminal domain-containing protein [Oscillospiraceae bacterium]|nr:neutral/alkaline non-lysosomal ceramidase N-terminal domain-containing protein [Oscillospiraceae bacterium]
MIKFGVAKDIVTPAERTTVMGWGTEFGKYFENIHDDLYVRALILQDAADNKVILVTMDLLFHDDTLPDALRDYIEDKYKIDRNCLHVSYTHTHNGPVLKGYDFTYYSESYEAFLFDRVCRCIDRALINMREGILEYGSVAGEWNMSRRCMVDGVMNFLPNPDGNVDKNIYMLKCSDTNGKMRALLMNYSCHPSNLEANVTLQLSAEYPGRLCQRIEGNHYGCTALFFQGCGGDSKLKQGMKSSRFQQISHDECDEVAGAMATRVNQSLVRGDFKKLDVCLKSKVFKIPLPLEIYTKSYYQKIADNNDVKSFYHIYAKYSVTNYDTLPDTLMLNCGAVQITPDLYIFSMGGEPSYDVKRVLQDMMGEKVVMFFGYSDAIAYIPSDKMIAEGGYEADGSVYEYRLKGRIAPGVDELYTSYFKCVIGEFN